MNTYEILIAARALIEKPENWMQGSDSPTVHCAGGAIFKIAGGSEYDSVTQLFLKANGEGPGFITSWNDQEGRTHAEVLAAFDRAIEATNPTPAQPKP